LLIDGKKATIPSMLVKPGQTLAIAPSSRENVGVVESLKAQEKRNFPSWVEMNVEKLQGIFKSLPSKDDIALPVKEQLIVELYSK
jgi:small subunit ribosomal protein S4